MSIIINGMKMPNFGHTMGILLYPNGDAYILSDEIPVTRCKAVELPPHGDLIDRGALMKQARSYWYNVYNRQLLHRVGQGGIRIDEETHFNYIPVGAVKDAPTIIEAETCNKSDEGAVNANNSITLQGLKLIDELPMVEVVECKDCRHRDPEDHKCDCGQLERAGCEFPVDDDYFCAYVER